jgi:alpha-L-fucosidase
MPGQTTRAARSIAAASVLVCLASACSGDRVVIGAQYQPSVDGGSSSLTIPSCPSLPGAPPGAAPLPTPKQVALQRLETMAFLHFGVSTFDGGTTPSASLFNPSDLNAAQWVSELKNAGFGQAILVVKNRTGFCLWPSAYTDYSVKNGPWKNGQGDVVKEFTDAMHAAGLRVAFQIAPADDSYPSSSAGYETYFRNQLSELLTNYGPVYEIELPGDSGHIPVDWAGVADLAHQLQPDIVVWIGPELATTGVDARYLGGQSGVSARSTSSIASVPNGGPSNVWYPPEGEVSSHTLNGINAWFWGPNDSVISLGTLQSDYVTTVGRNTTLVVNVPPDRTGQLDAPDVELLRQFGTWYAALYNNDLVQGKSVTADTTWENPGFDAAKAVDGNVCTYWAAANGRTFARLEVTPGSQVAFKVISIREPIELGERTTAYHVELKQNGSWNKAPTDTSGATIAGTVIGQRQLWQLNSTTAEAVALVIDSAKATPAIAEFSIY